MWSFTSLEPRMRTRTATVWQTYCFVKYWADFGFELFFELRNQAAGSWCRPSCKSWEEVLSWLRWGQWQRLRGYGANDPKGETGWLGRGQTGGGSGRRRGETMGKREEGWGVGVSGWRVEMALTWMKGGQRVGRCRRKCKWSTTGQSPVPPDRFRRRMFLRG